MLMLRPAARLPALVSARLQWSERLASRARRAQGWTSTEMNVCSLAACAECALNVAWTEKDDTPDEYRDANGRKDPSVETCKEYCDNMVENCIGFNFQTERDECYFLALTSACVFKCAKPV